MAARPDGLGSLNHCFRHLHPGSQLTKKYGMGIHRDSYTICIGA